MQKPTIRISFIRNGHIHNEARDDYVIISHKGEDMYHVYYHDANKSTRQHHFTILDAYELDLYVESLFTLVARDVEPFREVQVDIPCMPSVMYKPADLRKAAIRQALRDAMPMLAITTFKYVDPKNV